jgi:hypothetical protein
MFGCDVLLMTQVDADQVVMSHSPLRMFKQFHDKHVLVCGRRHPIDLDQLSIDSIDRLDF